MKAPTVEEVRALVAGDRVAMPCDPTAWKKVVRVRDLSTPGHPCFSIDCEGGLGHGGEMPLGIRKAVSP